MKSVWKSVVLAVSMSVVFGGALSSHASEPAPSSQPTLTVAPTLVPAVETFCKDLERMDRDPRLAKVAARDRLTVVLASVAEQHPGLDDFFEQVSQLPAEQRLGTIKRSFSRALGRTWMCEKLDALWVLR